MSQDDAPTTAEQGSATAAAPPPDGDRTPVAQRPEVQIAASFGGAFLLARILKRIFD